MGALRTQQPLLINTTAHTVQASSGWLHMQPREAAPVAPVELAARARLRAARRAPLSRLEAACTPARA